MGGLTTKDTIFGLDKNLDRATCSVVPAAKVKFDGNEEVGESAPSSTSNEEAEQAAPSSGPRARRRRRLRRCCLSLLFYI